MGSYLISEVRYNGGELDERNIKRTKRAVYS
jgi:hypothetical protein